MSNFKLSYFWGRLHFWGRLQIDTSFIRIKNDLEKFCSDFLKGDYKRFNYARQIQYLEYLLKPEVYGTYFRDGTKKFDIKYNDEIE